MEFLYCSNCGQTILNKFPNSEIQPEHVFCDDKCAKEFIKGKENEAS